MQGGRIGEADFGPQLWFQASNYDSLGFDGVQVDLAAETAGSGDVGLDGFLRLLFQAIDFVPNGLIIEGELSRQAFSELDP